MSDFLKSNWFVIVIAIILISFIGYFVIDSNQYNVSSKTADGKDVVTSIEGKDITADTLYDELSKFDSSLLYNMYHNAVVEQSVKTTSDIKEEATKLESTIRTNAQSQQENYEASLSAELAQYGYGSVNELKDYCIMTIKEKELNKKFITKHFDEYKEAVELAKPRTISLISMAVIDPNNLSDAEKEKQKNIDEALEKGSFADAATAFSEDATTAASDGFFGYIDSSLNNTPLDPTLKTEALELEKGQTSEWITVNDSNSGATSLYKIHINETNLEKMFKSKNESVKDQVLFSFLQNNKGLPVTIIEEAAKKLDVKFEDKEAQKKIEDFMKTQKGDIQ